MEHHRKLLPSSCPVVSCLSTKQLISCLAKITRLPLESHREMMQALQVTGGTDHWKIAPSYKRYHDFIIKLQGISQCHVAHHLKWQKKKQIFAPQSQEQQLNACLHISSSGESVFMKEMGRQERKITDQRRKVPENYCVQQMKKIRFR